MAEKFIKTPPVVIICGWHRGFFVEDLKGELESDVNKHLSEMDEHLKSIKSYDAVFEAAEARITLVVNTEGAFKGEGSHGVMNSHNHMHLPTIRSFRAVFATLIGKIEKMKERVLEFEPESNGSVSEEFWKTQLPNSYDNYEEALAESEKNINSAAAEVSHIINLGKLQTEDVYNNVDSARKHTEKVLEGLYELDQACVELMAEVRTELSELKATLKQVLNWIMTGGVRMTGVSIMEVGGYFANNATLHEKAPEVDTSKVNTGAEAAKLMENPAFMHGITNWSTDSLLNLEASTDPVLRQYMSTLYTLVAAGAHPDTVAAAAKILDDSVGRPVSQGVIQQAVLTPHSATDVYAMAFPLSAQATYVQQVQEARSNLSSTGKPGDGNVIYKWEGHGDKMTARGVPVDYEALGIEPKVDDIGDYQIRYTITEDNQFILFRDDPDLVYYTQGTKVGKAEWLMAIGGYLGAEYYGTRGLYKGANKIPGADKLRDRYSKETIGIAGHAGSYAAQHHVVPVWKEIVGAPIPKSGTEQLLVYVSDDDGETWNGKLLLTLKPNGNVEISRDFADGFWDAAKGLFKWGD
ncbi:T7SS effector LXG polymorphic toxin [Bacillus sp. FSL W7-1360]